ncbi:MAG TPA: PIG-L family deacetylase [Nocardioides sp.]|uniref:PIG-L deacetylase family protein n=1 Tax=Nocardioides sp. TaxID=35761 RepID=UPI002CA36656|nr:PIG-L family deacetylase [Nocardioides sp.]HQR25980.1 PIG-L family deacetylase [Nocardioides sp.]
MATVLSLHAHPDDEALLTGGWLAQRAAAGDRILLVFATDGEAGLTDASHATEPLGRRRRREALASAKALGAAEVRWLGYADSGMADAPTPASTTGSAAGYCRLVEAPIDEVARAVAAILDEEHVDVLTGYDAHGGYGHPDHVRVHQVARRAQELSAHRPVLLEATLDKTAIVRLLRVLRPAARLLRGLTLPGDDIYTARADLSLRVDVRDHLDAKRRALAAHSSQTGGGIRTIALLLALPRPLARRVLGAEWFHAVP